MGPAKRVVNIWALPSDNDSEKHGLAPVRKAINTCAGPNNDSCEPGYGPTVKAVNICPSEDESEQPWTGPDDDSFEHLGYMQ